MTAVLLTTADASNVYGIPARTIRRWAQEGRLTVIYEGGRNWYRDTEIVELIRLRATRRHA